MKENGFLEGESGNWTLTELDKQIGGQVRLKDNGEGGFYKRIWPVISWDEIVVDKLKKK